MTKHQNITAETIQRFALADLYLSDLNPRQEADPAEIDLLADSIETCGLIQNLAGLMDATGKIAIVAGGRRLRALARAMERNPELLTARPELATIPVQLAPDEQTARAWASAENAARADLHPADEIRAYGRMRKAGNEVAVIARVFATTEAHVYRRLALADLPAPVLDALRNGEISLSIASAFTIANDEARALEILDGIRGNENYTAQRVKTLLQPEAVALTDRRARFVTLETYQAEGGSITRDLFTESAFLHDADLLNRLFEQKLQAAAEGFKAEGWKWVDIVTDPFVSYTTTEGLKRLYRVAGDLNEDQTARYDELSEIAEQDDLTDAQRDEWDALDAILEGDYTDTQRQHSGLYVYVAHDGELRAEAAYVRREDFADAIAAEVLTGHAASSAATATEQDAAPKSPYSAALVDDMKTARLHALQSALLDKPELLLDLLAFMLSGKGGAYETLFDLSPREANIMPSKRDGLDADTRLDANQDRPSWMKANERIDAFTAFQAEGKKARNAALSLGLTRTLAYPHREAGFFDHIEAAAQADLRKVWTPTAEGFFSRVSAPYLDALMLDLTGCNPQGNGFKEWAKQKKAEKAASLERLFTDAEYQKAWKVSAESAERIKAWRPDCL